MILDHFLPLTVGAPIRAGSRKQAKTEVLVLGQPAWSWWSSTISSWLMLFDENVLNHDLLCHMSHIMMMISSWSSSWWSSFWWSSFWWLMMLIILIILPVSSAPYPVFKGNFESMMEPKLPEIGGRVVFNLLPGNRLQLALQNRWLEDEPVSFWASTYFPGQTCLLVSGRKLFPIHK